ncbi:MAG: hypothetical protein H0S85_10335 [Desulfovibrionaceae bacterium]|jgi:hypothetical protein|nr:hypothetical protein [Desulfovibrionaceae bacterium]
MSEKISDQEKAARKKAIWDAMSPRRRKFIERMGYDEWDPFAEPKDPIEIRKDPTNRTTQQLVREFFQTRPMRQSGYSTIYGQAVMECAIGIINNDERYQAIYEFVTWYNELVAKEGKGKQNA